MKINSSILKSLACDSEDVHTFEELFGLGEIELSELGNYINSFSTKMFQIVYDSGLYLHHGGVLEKGLDITDSTNVHRSLFISNSHDIRDSRFCSDSKGVQSSEGIQSSRFIRDSQNVQHSSHIYNSQKIMHSKYVKDSKSVLLSSAVIKSININNSTGIYYSADIKQGHGLFGCNEGEKLFFSRNLYKVSNKIFCTEEVNGTDDLPMVGNEEVSVEIFNKYIDTLNPIVQDLKDLVRTPSKITNDSPLGQFISEIKFIQEHYPRVVDMLLWKNRDILSDITFHI